MLALPGVLGREPACPASVGDRRSVLVGGTCSLCVSGVLDVVTSIGSGLGGLSGFGGEGGLG